MFPKISHACANFKSAQSSQSRVYFTATSSYRAHRGREIENIKENVTKIFIRHLITLLKTFIYRASQFYDIPAISPIFVTNINEEYKSAADVKI